MRGRLLLAAVAPGGADSALAQRIGGVGAEVDEIGVRHSATVAGVRESGQRWIAIGFWGGARRCYARLPAAGAASTMTMLLGGTCAPEIRLTDESMRGLRQAVCLAEKMGEGLAGGPLLLRTVPAKQGQRRARLGHFLAASINLLFINSGQNEHAGGNTPTGVTSGGPQ